MTNFLNLAKAWGRYNPNGQPVPELREWWTAPVHQFGQLTGS
jgi:hypothetical protein